MSNCVEIRWHGRGGQGAKTAALLLADVAFQTGKHVQGFPEYGPERMGAPITAYNRISDEAVRVHSNIYDPEYVVVVDETLLETVDVTNGLKKEGAIVINTEKPKEEIIPGMFIRLMRKKYRLHKILSEYADACCNRKSVRHFLSHHRRKSRSILLLL